MPELNDFNEAFRSMETQFRKKEHALMLEAIAKTKCDGRSPTLDFRSNFNATRCSGEMKQHLTAIRMRRAVDVFGAMHSEQVHHDFNGVRWQELAEIQAIETITGRLTFVAQHEANMTAGYWYHWLQEAFLQLNGSKPFAVVDYDRMTSSTVLPKVMRHSHDFTNLAKVVQARAMVEFKRRFGDHVLTDSTGLDVDPEWRPLMTKMFALPVLLDPRLCNATRLFGITSDDLPKHVLLLHELHYQLYLAQRDRDLARLNEEYQAKIKTNEELESRRHVLRKKRELEEQRIELERAELASTDTATDTATIVEVDEPYYDGDDSDTTTIVEGDELTSMPMLIEPPPTLDLIPWAAFLVLSESQLAACKAHAKAIDWKLLCVGKNQKYDRAYQVGKQGVNWRANLRNVSLTPVWKQILADDDCELKYGFFPHLATNSKGSIAHLSASSFCERVNSAAKIVMTDRYTCMYLFV
jgi:hypothetical protein